MKNETTGYLNDFYQLDPIATEWTNLTSLSQRSAPSPRADMGFTALDSVLYVFGGQGYEGDLVLPCARTRSLSVTVASFDRGEHIRLPQRYVHVWPERDVVDGCWDCNVSTHSEIFLRVHFSAWEALGLWGNGIQWCHFEHQSVICSHGFLCAVNHSSCFGPDRFIHFFNFTSNIRSDAGFPLNDLHVYDKMSEKWTDATNLVQGQPPPPRYGLGFAAVAGKLFVFGGTSITFGNI